MRKQGWRTLTGCIFVTIVQERKHIRVYMECRITEVHSGTE
jgi:hypothetical protein